MTKTPLDGKEETLREIIARDPNDKEAWINLSMILTLKKDFEGAEEAARKALELDPLDGEFWFAFGVVLNAKQDLEGAKKAFHKVLELNPNSANAWFNLARVAVKQEDWVDAEEAYRKVLELDPNDIGAWLNLGVVLNQRDNLAGAEEAYRKALELKPTYTQAWLNLGLLLGSKSKDLQGAEEAFRKVLELEPRNLVAWNFLGTVLIEKGDLVGAEVAFREGLKVDPYCTLILGKLFGVIGTKMYIPSIRTATPKKQYQLGPYEAVIVGDIESVGQIKYEYLLFLYEQGKQEPIYFVSAEKNALASATDTASHFLCTFEGMSHQNYGLAYGLDDLDFFTKQALQIVARKYNLSKEVLPELDDLLPPSRPVISTSLGGKEKSTLSETEKESLGIRPQALQSFLEEIKTCGEFTFNLLEKYFTGEEITKLTTFFDESDRISISVHSGADETKESEQVYKIDSPSIEEFCEILEEFGTKGKKANE